MRGGALAPDVVELLGDGFHIQVGECNNEARVAPAASAAATEETVSLSSTQSSRPAGSPLASFSSTMSFSVLRFSYHGRACELSVDSTTGRLHLRCAWLPRRLRQLVLRAPEASVRDLFILLPLLRKVAFFLSVAEEAAQAYAGEADLLPASEAGAERWSPPPAVVKQGLASLAVQAALGDRTEGARRLYAARLSRTQQLDSLETTAQEKDDHAGRRPDLEHPSQQGQPREAAEVMDATWGESSPQQPVGVIASEAVAALERVVHLRRYVFGSIKDAGLPSSLEERWQASTSLAEASSDAEVQRKDNTSFDLVRAAKPALPFSLRNRRGGGYEVATATCFFRVPPAQMRAGERRAGISPPSSSSSSAFIVALSLVEERVVACSYLLFPAPQCRGVPTTGVMPALQSLRFLLGSDLFPSDSLGVSDSVDASPEKLFASVRLLHRPFVLTTGATATSCKTASALPKISVTNYLRAVGGLLRSHDATLTQLNRVSGVLPLLLPCTARGDVGEMHYSQVSLTSTADRTGHESASAAVSQSEDTSSKLPDVSTGENASRGFVRPSSIQTRNQSYEGCLDLSAFFEPASAPSPALVVKGERKGVPANFLRPQSDDAREVGAAPGHDCQNTRLVLRCTLDRDFMSGVGLNRRGSLLRDLFLVSGEQEKRRSAAMQQHTAARLSHRSTVETPEQSAPPPGSPAASDGPSRLSVPSPAATAPFPRPSPAVSPSFSLASGASAFSLSISPVDIAFVLDDLDAHDVELKLPRSEFERMCSSTALSDGSLVLLKWLGDTGTAGSRPEAQAPNLPPLIEAIGKVKRSPVGATCFASSTPSVEISGDQSRRPASGSDDELSATDDVVGISCTSVRAVCTLSPTLDDAHGPDAEASTSSADARSSAVAGAVGRCFAAFLRIQVYVQLHQQLRELHRNIYGPQLRVVRCSFTAVEFLLQPCHSSCSSFIGTDSEAEAVASPADFREEKLRCRLDLGPSPALSAFPETRQRLSVESPSVSLPRSFGGGSRASPVVDAPGSYADPEKTTVLAAAHAVSGKSRKPEGALLKFSVEASTPQLTWLLRRQKQAAARLLPRHLSTLLQLLASSSEILACCVQLPLALFLNVPPKRYPVLYQGVQQRQLQLAVSRNFASWGNRQLAGPSAADDAASTEGEHASQVKPFTSQDGQQGILGIWDLLKRPEEQFQALTEAAAGAGLELTQVYVQSVVPTRAETAAIGGPLKTAPDLSADSFGLGAHTVGAVVMPAAEDEDSGSDRESEAVASASLPALLLRVPGLPPVLMRLSSRCRCLLELQIVLQETREQLGGDVSKHKQETDPSKSKPEAPSRSHPKSKTVTYVDVLAAVKVAGLADAWVTASASGDLDKENQLFQQLQQDITFEVSLLASFAGALRQFAAAACADLRQDGSVQVAGHFQADWKRPGETGARGTESRAGVHGDHGRQREAESPIRRSGFRPQGSAGADGVAYSPSFPGSLLLGYNDSSVGDASPSPVPLSRLGDLSSLFVAPGSCLGITCYSPLLLGANHSLLATAPVANLAFWPGLLLQQVLLPLLQLCKVFAAYSTAKVSLHRQALLLYRKSPASQASPNSSKQPRRGQQPVEVESIVLSPTSSATGDTSTPISGATPGGETNDSQAHPDKTRSAESAGTSSESAQTSGEDGLRLWVSYTDFASRACCCVVPSQGGLSDAVKPPHLRTQDTSPARSDSLLQPTDSTRVRHHPAQNGEPSSGPEFVRPELYGLPWPLVTTGGVVPQAGESVERAKTEGTREEECILRWSAAMSHALLLPWDSSYRSGGALPRVERDGTGGRRGSTFCPMRGQETDQERGRSQNGADNGEVPPILPRLHRDDSGK